MLDTILIGDMDTFRTEFRTWQLQRNYNQYHRARSHMLFQSPYLTYQ